MGGDKYLPRYFGNFGETGEIQPHYNAEGLMMLGEKWPGQWPPLRALG